MIEVGEYIRFGYNQFQGEIRKVIGRNIDNQIILDDNYDGDNYLNKYEEEHDIRNHSKNIIDVIEPSDLVNGLIVESVHHYNHYYDNRNPLIVVNGEFYTEDNIRTILTHEQYNKNCYRLL